MAGDIPNLNVEVLVQLTNLAASVQEAVSGLTKIGDAAEDQKPKIKSFKDTMAGVFVGNLLTKGAEEAGKALHDMFKFTEDNQTSLARLSVALKNTKNDTAAASTAIAQTTEKMGNLGFSAVAVQDSMGTLVTATGSVTQATSLMGVAANLARYKHEDLGTAATTLAKATQGNAKAFKEFGITLDTNLPKNEAIKKAMEELNAKTKDQADAYGKTLPGMMDIMKTKYEEILVQIGNKVIPIITELVGWITKHIKIVELVVAAIAAYIVITKTYSAITTTVKMATEAWTAAQKALNIVLEMNPIGLVVIAVGLLIAGLVLLWNHSELFRKIMIEVGKAGIEALGWIIRTVGDMIVAFLKFETIALRPILKVAAALHFPGAKTALDFINNGIADVGNFFDSTAAKVDGFASKLDGLNKKVVAPKVAPALDTTSLGTDFTGDVKGGDQGGGASKAASKAEKALAARNAKIKAANDEAIKLEDQMNSVLVDRQNKIADASAKLQETQAAAQDNYNQAVEAAETAHSEAILNIQQQYADKAIQITQQANDQRKSIIQQSISLMTSAFESATKIDLGKLFTAGGTSASGLQDQLKSQLADVLQLQKDTGLLAAQGYNQSFIDEVIAQGPQQGDALAQAVLTAAPDTQASIKDLYNQINSVSQDGVTDLATKMNDGVHFANEKLAQQFDQVGVDLNANLAKNSADLQTALNVETDKYNAALTKAQATLTKAMNAAQDSFDASVKSISDSTMKQLDALQAKLDATAAKIQSLGGSTASITGYQASTSNYTPAATSVNTSSLSGIAAASAPLIGSITQNVHTTDASLPTVTDGILNVIALGQTQGIFSSKAYALSNSVGSGF